MPRRRVSESNAREMNDNEREKLEAQGPTNELKKGEEEWFQLEAGLPRGGLDPEKDTSHVSDEELIKVFGRKVPNRGYLYKEAIVAKVTMRAEEIYKPIYQTECLPEQYISESFARALVSEICHLMPMNWARYAEGVWARKKGDVADQMRRENAPTVRIEISRAEKTYESAIVERLELESREEDAMFQAATNTLQRVRMTLVELRDRTPGDGSEIEGRAQVERKIKRSKLSLDMAKCNLKFVRKFLEEVSSEFETDLLAHYKEREVEEEQNVLRCQQELEEALQGRLEFDKPLTDAMKRERELQAEIETFIPMLERKRKILEQLKGSSHRTLILRPSKSLIESSREVQVPTFQWMPCALCKTPFPLKDVVLAPCMCLYHPWCIVMQNWISDSCAKDDCKMIFDDSWQKSHGLFYMQGKSSQNHITLLNCLDDIPKENPLL
jgi:hypothetical protein